MGMGMRMGRTIGYLSGRGGEGALLEEREGSTSSKHDEDGLEGGR